MIWLFVIAVWLCASIALALGWAAYRATTKRLQRSILNQRNAITRMDSANWPQW